MYNSLERGWAVALKASWYTLSQKQHKTEQQRALVVEKVMSDIHEDLVQVLRYMSIPWLSEAEADRVYMALQTRQLISI